jgi:hypothetical protein
LIVPKERAMDAAIVASEHSRYLDWLTGQVGAADDTTPALLSSVAAVCERMVAPAHRAKFAQIQRLIADRASTEAALAMIELELPRWKLRRLVYDEGDWHCALSAQRELPEWLDETVEASHRQLALAILAAFLEAMQRRPDEMTIGRPTVPEFRAGGFEPVLCDNFA